MTERVLVIGKGGREHALASKLAGFNAREVLIISGNPGIAREFECISPRDSSMNSLVDAILRVTPDLVIVGPENYLAMGLADVLRNHKIATFGPSITAAQLEESKSFTKAVCDQALIPQARYQKFDNLIAARSFVMGSDSDDMVIKVDGLCSGKGVTVCSNKDNAINTLINLFEKNGFHALGATRHVVVIEEFLKGSEVSVFGAANGLDVVLFCPMQDYKTLNNFGHGPNTGGMGAVGPLGTDSDEREKFLNIVKEQFFIPTLKVMKQAGRPFSGLLYAGLMLTEQGMHLLEYNVRFGDPETQALLWGSDFDIYPLISAIARNEPFDSAYFQRELLRMTPSISIVVAGAGYPFALSPPQSITKPDHLPLNSQILFADALAGNDAMLLSGSGRVLNIVARGSSVDAARTLGYSLLREINFAGMQYRTDIGTNLTRLNCFE